MDYNVTYREKDKGWQIIISYKTSAGKWKQKSKQGFASKRDAKKEFNSLLNSIPELNELNSDFDNITFEEFIKIYLEHISLYVQENSIKVINTALPHFSTLNNLEISKINTLHIQLCIDEMVRNNLSYNTIKTYYCRINAIFNIAKNKFNIISTIPTKNIELTAPKSKSTKTALSVSELNILINKTACLKYKVILSLAGMCGLRIGEITGLKWSDIDFNTKTITVQSQWKHLKDNTVGFGELKSINSYRTVPMPPKVKELLLEWVNFTPTHISNRIIVYAGSTTASVCMKKHLKRSGYNMSIHELRHTYATALIANNVDFKTIAKLMGHDIEQTLRTYSHVTDDMLTRATDLLEKIF
ncbi:MAG: site-specific integrase [Clostridium sp.]